MTEAQESKIRAIVKRTGIPFTGSTFEEAKEYINDSNAVCSAQYYSDIIYEDEEQ